MIVELLFSGLCYLLHPTSATPEMVCPDDAPYAAHAAHAAEKRAALDHHPRITVYARQIEGSPKVESAATWTIAPDGSELVTFDAFLFSGIEFFDDDGDLVEPSAPLVSVDDMLASGTIGLELRPSDQRARAFRVKIDKGLLDDANWIRGASGAPICYLAGSGENARRLHFKEDFRWTVTASRVRLVAVGGGEDVLLSGRGNPVRIVVSNDLDQVTVVNPAPALTGGDFDHWQAMPDFASEKFKALPHCDKGSSGRPTCNGIVVGPAQ